MIKKAWRPLWAQPIIITAIICILLLLISYGPKTQGEITRALKRAINGLPVKIKAKKGN